MNTMNSKLLGRINKSIKKMKKNYKIAIILFLIELIVIILIPRLISNPLKSSGNKYIIINYVEIVRIVVMALVYSGVFNIMCNQELLRRNVVKKIVKDWIIILIATIVINTILEFLFHVLTYRLSNVLIYSISFFYKTLFQISIIYYTIIFIVVDRVRSNGITNYLILLVKQLKYIFIVEITLAILITPILYHANKEVINITNIFIVKSGLIYNIVNFAYVIIYTILKVYLIFFNLAMFCDTGYTNNEFAKC